MARAASGANHIVSPCRLRSLAQGRESGRHLLRTGLPHQSASQLAGPVRPALFVADALHDDRTATTPNALDRSVGRLLKSEDTDLSEIRKSLSARDITRWHGICWLRFGP
jgi:hypothetical protein